MTPSFETRTKTFVVDPDNPVAANIAALEFYNTLPERHPSPDSPEGGIGERIIPFFFIGGGIWVIVYIVLYHHSR